MIFEKIQLEADEEIIQAVRRHWFYIFKQCVFVVLLVILPLCGFLLISFFASDVASFKIHEYLPYVIFLYSFWILINWMVLATIWTDYYLDIWCITNRRVIKIDQIALFNRKTGSFRLERIQDINVEVKGIIETLLDYGTIHVQTASEDAEEFKANYLPKPQEIKATILKASDALMQKNNL